MSADAKERAICGCPTGLERTVVAIGCSRDADYAFPLIFTCLLWKDVIGFHPLALLVGEYKDWAASQRNTQVVSALVDHKIDYRFIGRADGYPEHTTAQNCRQHASALTAIDDETWVMPADADLWPLRREFYHQHEGKPHRAVALYSNGDHFPGKDAVLERAAKGLGTQTLPTCHVTMRARDWRAIYSPIPNDVAGSIKKTLDKWMPTRVSVEGYDMGFHLWMSDQQVMTVALCKQPWFPSGALLVLRRGHPPVDRLDRSHPNDWALPFDASRWTDAHVHKAPYKSGNWQTLLKIIDALLPEHSAWARDYRESYVGVGE